MALVFFLLFIYQVKHFLCDFPFQTEYQLGKFKEGWDFIPPLATHCGIHASFTFVIASAFLAGFDKFSLTFALSLALLDFAIHFTMDRVKASPHFLGQFKALTKDEYIKVATALKETEKVPDGLWENVNRATWQKKLRGNTYFWLAIGLDQAVHHLTHYAIIWFLIHRIWICSV